MKALQGIVVAIVFGLLIGLATSGFVCLGSWIDGTGGCPARMPWEMHTADQLYGCTSTEQMPNGDCP